MFQLPHFISPVQSSGLQPSAYLNHFKWSFSLTKNSLVIVTISIFDQWADSLPLACLVNYESFFWFGLSKPQTCISCRFKCFVMTEQKCIDWVWTEQLKPNTMKKKKNHSRLDSYHLALDVRATLRAPQVILLQSNWQQENYAIFLFYISKNFSEIAIAIFKIWIESELIE